MLVPAVDVFGNVIPDQPTIVDVDTTSSVAKDKDSSKSVGGCVGDLCVDGYDAGPTLCMKSL